MALERHDREDLLAEATAMPIRGSWRIGSDQIFIGWRDPAAASIYWNSEPVLQLDPSGRIRRCFWRGERIAAVRGELVWLRSHPGGRVQMERVPLSEEEREQLLSELAARLEMLAKELDAATLVGATEPETDFRQRCRQLLRSLPSTPQIARRPGLGKRT